MFLGFTARSTYSGYGYRYGCDPHSRYLLTRCRPFCAPFLGYSGYGYGGSAYPYGVGPIYGLGTDAAYRSELLSLPGESDFSVQGATIQHAPNQSGPRQVPLVASPVPPEVLPDINREEQVDSATVDDADRAQQEGAQPED